MSEQEPIITEARLAEIKDQLQFWQLKFIELKGYVAVAEVTRNRHVLSRPLLRRLGEVIGPFELYEMNTNRIYFCLREFREQTT